MPYGEKRIPIGRRRERVAIEQAVTADDGMGGQTVTKWKTVAEPWAKIEALDERSKEALIAMQITGRHAYHVAIPYQAWPDTTGELRIIVRDTTMEVHSNVDDEGLKRRRILQVGEIQR